MILVLDEAAGFDLSRARRLIAARIPAVPRLRQRLIRAPFGCGGRVWVNDPKFDIRGHVHMVVCREPGDEQAPLDTDLSVIMAPLRRAAPLWSAVFVTGLADGAVALVLVLHHVLVDGVGGLAVLANLVNARANAANVSFPGPRPPRPGSPKRRTRAGCGAAPCCTAVSPAARFNGRRGSPATAGHPLFTGQRTGSRRKLTVARAAESGCTPARRDDERRHPGRGGGRAAPGADGQRGSPSTHSGWPCRYRPPPRQRARTRQHGQPDAHARPGHGRSGTAAGAGRRPGPRAQGVRHRATPDRRAGLAVPATAALGGYHWYMNHQHRFHTPVSRMRGPAKGVTFGGSAITSTIPIGIGEGGTSRSTSTCFPTRAPSP